MRFPSRREGQGTARAASRHTGRAGRQDVFPAGANKWGSAGEAGSLIARAREKISAARRSWRPVDGQAGRGTLPGREEGLRTLAAAADARGSCRVGGIPGRELPRDHGRVALNQDDGRCPSVGCHPSLGHQTSFRADTSNSLPGH